jgi:ribosomal 50S subunit-recycling heat shock protein
MINRYIPHLSWKTKNLAYILLYTVFKHTINKTLDSSKKDTSYRNINNKLSRSNSVNLNVLRKSTRKIKNNQFNIKWFFNKYLKNYYNINISKLFHIESRLDVILFRTNWFVNKEAVKTAIKNGLIKINKKVEQSSTKQIKPGDIIEFNDLNFNKKLLLSNFYKSYIISDQTTYLKSSLFALNNWNLENSYNLIPNIPYLEINNKIKVLIMLKSPTFPEIPYPFNLRKFKG